MYIYVTCTVVISGQTETIYPFDAELLKHSISGGNWGKKEHLYTLHCMKKAWLYRKAAVLVFWEMKSALEWSWQLLLSLMLNMESL